MIIRRLALRNFRQFIGDQAIDFAVPETAGRKNVTVVYGENGRGKTGLYRALLFGLFGDIKLNQDDDVTTSDMRLVNLQQVMDAPETHAVEASVEVTFSHLDKVYSVERTRIAARRGNSVLEDPGTVILRITLPDGNTRVVPDEVMIREEIGAILDPRVKDYYLFDGERMDRLTRAGSSQRLEVAKGIRSLLNIDALEDAYRAMDKVTEKLSADLTKVSSVGYARVLSEIETCQRAMRDIRARSAEIESELAGADDEVQRLDRLLGDYKEIKAFIDARNELSEKREARIRERSDLERNLSSAVSRSCMLLLRPVVTQIYGRIDKVRKSGELPAEIRRDLIERVIARDECICGRPVLADPAVFTAVKSWLDRTTEEAIEDSALQLWQQLAGLVMHLDDYGIEVERHLHLYGNASNDIAAYEGKLDEIATAIGSSERKDAGDLEAQRGRVVDKKVPLLAEQLVLDEKMREHRSALAVLNARKEEEAGKQAKKDEILVRVDLARSVTEALDMVKSRFTTEIRDRLGHLATRALEQLLDHPGKANICNVRVADNYTIEVFNRYGDAWLAQISAGQRQVLSIAFVAALAEAASNGELLEMPLFMDTPFGRLGAVHRENLMKLVPNKAAQWVLLATDSEFRGEEANMLDATGSWGKLYFLEQENTGNTIIRERDASVQAFNSYLAGRR